MRGRGRGGGGHRVIGEGPAAAVAGYRHVNGSRIERAHVIVAYVHLRSSSGQEILDDNIGGGRELLHDALAGG